MAPSARPLNVRSHFTPVSAVMALFLTAATLFELKAWFALVGSIVSPSEVAQDFTGMSTTWAAPGCRPLAGRIRQAGVATRSRLPHVSRAAGPADIITPITSAEQFAAKIATGAVTIAVFSSPLCGPCLLMEPIVQKIAEEFGAYGLNVVKLNLMPGKGLEQDIKDLFKELQVRELPTYLVFSGGEIQERITGTKGTQLRQAVAEYL